MTQGRTIPAAVAKEIERQTSPDALIWFLTITHVSLAVPIRVVSDHFDYIVDGETYQGFPFDALPLNDNDQQPSAELIVPNIDRRIGRALENAKGRAIVQATARTTSEFDLTLDPREAIGGLTSIYSWQQFELTEVQGDAMMLTGRISLIDYSQEPWPYLRATADRCPGLFV